MYLSKYFWCIAFLCGCNCLNIVNNFSKSDDNHPNEQRDFILAIGNTTISFTLKPTKTTAAPTNAKTTAAPTNATTTAAPTNATTTSTTAAPTTMAPPACTCGTGGRPRVGPTARRHSEKDFDKSANVEHNDLEFSLQSKQNDVRVVSGLASAPNAWPWMVALIQGFNANNTNGSTILNQFCGGTLINAQYVVTAAHCFNNFTNTAQIVSGVSILLGTNSLLSNVKPRSVARISAVNINPLFNRTTFDNDIAILKLAVPITISNTTRPICLSQTGTPFANNSAIVVGWGTAQRATNSTTSTGQRWLREAGMQTISNARCNTFGQPITPGMICALGRSPFGNISSPCFGDSGGPLMIFRPTTNTFNLIGIVSNGFTPCGDGTPTIFARVNSFLSFITSVTNGTAFCSNSFT